MDERALAYLISLGIIGAGFGWIAVAHSALIIALGVLTICGWGDQSFDRTAQQDVLGRGHARACQARSSRFVIDEPPCR